MARRANPAYVGAFVIGAIALAVVGVALLGSGKLFRQTHEFVCFFDGNVNGLNVGAPVKFKGVAIGEVKQILLSLNAASGPTTVGNTSVVKIPVLIELDEGRILKRGATYINVGNPAGMRLAISRGLRAQLATESLLTGLLYIDLCNSSWEAVEICPTGWRVTADPPVRSGERKVCWRCHDLRTAARSPFCANLSTWEATTTGCSVSPGSSRRFGPAARIRF